MLSRHTQKPNHEAAKQGALHTHVLAGHACSSATQSLEDASNRADVLDTAKGLLGFRDGSEDLDTSTASALLREPGVQHAQAALISIMEIARPG